MRPVHPSIPSDSLFRRSKHAFVAVVIGFAYWWSFSLLSSVDEPWDGLHYWSAGYPVSLLLSAALGFVFRRDALVIGLSLTLAQVPVIVLNTGFDSSITKMVYFLSFLSLPTLLAAKVGTTMRMHALQKEK